ncbi:hypothetical protein [Streptomyces sp. NPDC058773]|uniref:hypothetical protein n=1 Tax=Streptomyces sp. NPDC058773 TaxID=3346632 RepID=UPI0036BF300F
MHGPVPALPSHRPPARGAVILLRVVFVAVTVLSLGFLAWAALLRAALVQRKPLGWWLFGADLALLTGTIVWSGGYPDTDWHMDVAVAVILLQMAGTVAYYLVVDQRAQRTAGQMYGPPAGQVPGHGAAYGAGPAGYPAAPHPYGPAPHHAQEPPPYAAPGGAAPVNPYALTETRLPRPGQPGAPSHPAPPPAGPYAPPPEWPQPPQRIDRVRAELDELSDYLRKEEGR